MCMYPKPKNPKENKVTVLGLGGSGRQILHHIAKQCDNYNLLYADSDEASLLESTIKTVKTYNNGQTDFVSIIKEIKDCEKLIITTGLGGEFGSFNSCIIYKMAKNENIPDVKLILTMPASFEGKEQKERANEVLELFKSENADYELIEFDKLIDNLDRKISINDCYKIMDEIMYKEIMRIITNWVNLTVYYD